MVLMYYIVHVYLGVSLWYRTTIEEGPFHTLLSQTPSHRGGNTQDCHDKLAWRAFYDVVMWCQIKASLESLMDAQLLRGRPRLSTKALSATANTSCLTCCMTCCIDASILAFVIYLSYASSSFSMSIISEIFSFLRFL